MQKNTVNDPNQNLINSNQNLIDPNQNVLSFQSSFPSRQSVRDLLYADATPATINTRNYTSTPDSHNDINDDYFEYYDDSNYAISNTNNGYDSSNISSFDEISSYSSSSTSSMEDPYASKSSVLNDLFGSTLRSRTAENLNFQSLTSMNMGLHNQTTNNSYNSSNSSANNSIMNPNTNQSVQYNKEAQLKKFNTLMSNYLVNPDGLFIMDNIIFDEIPEILKTIDSIKCLIVSQCGIKSLKNLPPYLETLEIKCNNIVSVTTEDLPSTITTLNITKNKLNFVDLGRSYNIKTLNLANNPLKEVFGLPPNVQDLCLVTTEFSNVDVLNKLLNLQILKLNSCHVNCIDNLPDTIIDLTMSRLLLYGGQNNTLGHIQKLPKQLMKFVCHSSAIKRKGFTHFPLGLTYLDIYENELISLPTLPEATSYVDISNNMLVSVSNIPKNIETYEATGNINLTFTPEQTTIIEYLKMQPNVTVNLTDLTNDWETHNAYNPNSYLINSNSNNYNNNNESPAITFGTSSRNLMNPNATSTSNSNMTNYFGNMGRTTLYNQNNQNNQNNRNSGFGNFGSRKNFDTQFGTRGQTNNVQKPEFPPYVAKLMGGDRFVPSKQRNRKIKHEHIYYV